MCFPVGFLYTFKSQLYYTQTAPRGLFFMYKQNYPMYIIKGDFMYTCNKCKNETEVEKFKDGKGYCYKCKAFTVDIKLHRLTKRYFDKVKKIKK